MQTDFDQSISEINNCKTGYRKILLNYTTMHFYAVAEKKKHQGEKL